MKRATTRRRMTADDLLAACESQGIPVSRSGDAYNTHCFLHHDVHRSLSFGEKEDGTMWLHCHAGCTSTREGFIAMLKAIGGKGTYAELDPRELERRERARAAEKVHAEDKVRALAAKLAPVTEIPPALMWPDPMPDVLMNGGRYCFIIRDSVGEIVGIDSYAAPGTPAREQAEANGFAKLKAEAGSARLGWPQVETIVPGDYLIAVEGAPCAATIIGVGAPALAYASASGIRVEEARRIVLAGHLRVIVLADSDEPGRRGAQASVVMLRAAGARAVAVDLAPGETDGRDVADLLRTFESKTAAATWLTAQLETYRKELS